MLRVQLATCASGLHMYNKLVNYKKINYLTTEVTYIKFNTTSDQSSLQFGC